MASRDKVDVDTFHNGIQYALERLGKLKFGFESTTVSNFKSKSLEGSGKELVHYSRAPCLGADQKARWLWERDWLWEQTFQACAIYADCAVKPDGQNRPFPSSLVPLFQNESKCETFHMKMSSACSFIFMQIKIIFIRMVLHLDSFWNRGTRELGNGYFLCYFKMVAPRALVFRSLVKGNEDSGNEIGLIGDSVTSNASAVAIKT